MQTTKERIYTARDFEPDDILLIALRPQERATWYDTDLLAIGLSKHGHAARTLLANDEVVACYGLLSPWPTLGILWAFVNTQAIYHRWTLWRVWLKEWRGMLALNPTLQRIEALTLAEEDPAAARVLHHLHFIPGALKTEYGPHGEAYQDWCWLREKGMVW